MKETKGGSTHAVGSIEQRFELQVQFYEFDSSLIKNESLFIQIK